MGTTIGSKPHDSLDPKLRLTLSRIDVAGSRSRFEEATCGAFERLIFKVSAQGFPFPGEFCYRLGAKHVAYPRPTRASLEALQNTGDAAKKIMHSVCYSF